MNVESQRLPGPCVYCGDPADSREHWLPRGLGAIRGPVTLQDRLCEGCNRALGRELDEELSRTGPTGFLRAAHGIKGRSGHTQVSPFLYQAATRHPTMMRMPAPEGEGTILAEFQEPDGQTKVSRALRQLVVRRPDGELEHVPFPQAWTADNLREALRTRGLEPGELVEVYLGEGETPESEDVRRLLSDVFGAFKGAKVWYGNSDQLIIKYVEAKIGISRKYLRALAKVGFHYFMSVSPSYRGDEPEFEALRRFIRHDEGDWKHFVVPTTEHFIPELQRGARPSRPSHFLYAEVNSEQVLVRAQFFAGPEYLPYPSLVRLGSSSSRIIARWMRAHWVQYFDEKTDGYDGELGEVDVTPRRIIVP